ncbi:hypothetical protein [Polyangium spumosum]|uniref:Alpha/beta hydrolase n=1 Tax=Polyangium spumosum TaxID=889282 RepID=A0A6N7PH77_9BACT|nr:hypothetical protein [Polyangium spumosum]MRG91359.1 hypothetical protein [Polyangium spumosum]
MPGGNLLQRAWSTASNAAKKTAGAITGGAKAIGDGIVSGAKAVGNAAVAIKDGIKEGVRSGTRAVADAGYNALGAGKDALDSGAKKVSDAYGKAKEFFTGQPPAQPCIACTGKDVDHDGSLFGYVNGQCKPLTDKGQPVTPDDVAKAKQAGYNPVTNKGDRADKKGAADEGDYNTSAETSECCKKCNAGKPPRTIFYVNGINTDRDAHCKTLKQIGDMTCATVIGVYNATEGFARDAQQTSKDRRLIREAAAGKKDLTTDGRNPAVNTLSDLVVQEREAGRPVEIFAHSQGGAVTSLALFDANNELKAGSSAPNAGLDGNVKVTSFGSAAPQWVQGPDYEHYVHVNDATPMVFGLGDKKSDHDKYANGDVVLFSGERGQKADFAMDGQKLDKNWLPGMTEYHGIDDDLYFKAYNQKQKADKTGDTCGCGKNK